MAKEAPKAAPAELDPGSRIHGIATIAGPVQGEPDPVQAAMDAAVAAHNREWREALEVDLAARKAAEK